MDSLQAARALRLIRPKIAIRIHWGTLAPLRLHLRHWSYLARPPHEFLGHARDLAPDVDVRVLEPGASFVLDAPPGRALRVGPWGEDGAYPGDAARMTEPA